MPSMNHDFAAGGAGATAATAAQMLAAPALAEPVGGASAAVAAAVNCRREVYCIAFGLKSKPETAGTHYPTSRTL